MEGLDSKTWGLFLFLPVATAAAAAMPTGPEREKEQVGLLVKAEADKKNEQQSVDCFYMCFSLPYLTFQ